MSEGRRDTVIARLTTALRGVPGCHLLDASSDRDHNRTVFSLAGEAGPLHEALLALIDVAVQDIDLTEHRGVHPCFGAVDVIPFVPLEGCTMVDAVTTAHELGQWVGTEFGLPVFFYGEAATNPAYRRLAELRRGGVTGLKNRLMSGDWHPDKGPAAAHPTAGAVAVGARFFLIAFNVVLNSAEVEVARSVARRVRESSGGLPAVSAIGVPLASRDLVQVSMNLTDYRRTSIAQAVEAVRRLAAIDGVSLRETEIVGLAPQSAFAGVDPEEIQLINDPDELILEGRLRRVSS